MSKFYECIELYVMMNDSYKPIAHPTFLTWKPHATTRKEPILVEDSWRSALPCMGARPRTQVGGLKEFNNIGVGNLYATYTCYQLSYGVLNIAHVCSTFIGGSQVCFMGAPLNTSH